MSVTGPGCGLGFAYAYTADELAAWRASLAPEDDWRPLPSAAEVLAHNARTGGDCFGPWLMLCESDEYSHGLRVEVIHLAADDDGVEAKDNDGDRIRAGHRRGVLKFRPITRRGEALPWPEVGRLRAQIAAAHGVTTPPTDDELSDEAATWIVTAPHSAGYAVRVLNAEDARRYRDNARGVHVWHLWDERTGCPAPRITATPDRDLCPTCGALDLDHSPEECARRWAEAHPYAAGAMHGGIAHKSEVAK